MRISDWSSDVCSSDLRVHFTQPLVPLHMQSAARFAEQPGKGFIKHRHALAALTTTHLQSIGLQSVDAGAQRRDPLVISPGKEIIIENNYLAVSVNAAGEWQLWTFSLQAPLPHNIDGPTAWRGK